MDNPYSRGNERVSYYKERGIGEQAAYPGPFGPAAFVWRIPRKELKTVNEIRKIQKNEYNANMREQAEARALAKAYLERKMQENVGAIRYTNDPVGKIDIDGSINLVELADAAKDLYVKEAVSSLQKSNRHFPWRMSMMKKQGINIADSPEINYTIDKGIETLRRAFVEKEKEKMTAPFLAQAKKKLPNWPTRHNSAGVMMRESEQRYEQKRLLEEHIAKKMPKIEAVLEKVREGMILGFAPPPAKPVQKEENLLRFENLSSINFSKPAVNAAAPAAPGPLDPFEELLAGKGGKRKTRRHRHKKTTRRHKRI